MQRVLTATAKQPQQNFMTRKFREKIEDYCGTAAMDHGVEMCIVRSWNGWIRTTSNAHTLCRRYCLRRNCLTSTRLEIFLYMIREMVYCFTLSHLSRVTGLIARTIALLLHKRLQEAFDAAKFAIIPILGADKGLTRWKVFLVDQTISNQQAYHQQSVVKWKVSKNARRSHTMILSRWCQWQRAGVSERKPTGREISLLPIYHDLYEP